MSLSERNAIKSGIIRSGISSSESYAMKLSMAQVFEAPLFMAFYQNKSMPSVSYKPEETSNIIDILAQKFWNIFQKFRIFISDICEQKHCLFEQKHSGGFEGMVIYNSIYFIQVYIMVRLKVFAPKYGKPKINGIWFFKKVRKSYSRQTILQALRL